MAVDSSQTWVRLAPEYPLADILFHCGLGVSFSQSSRRECSSMSPCSRVTGESRRSFLWKSLSPCYGFSQASKRCPPTKDPAPVINLGMRGPGCNSSHSGGRDQEDQSFRPPEKPFPESWEGGTRHGGSQL
jgi:hypothetical protein